MLFVPSASFLRIPWKWVQQLPVEESEACDTYPPRGDREASTNGGRLMQCNQGLALTAFLRAAGARIFHHIRASLIPRTGSPFFECATLRVICW